MATHNFKETIHMAQVTDFIFHTMKQITISYENYLEIYFIGLLTFKFVVVRVMEGFVHSTKITSFTLVPVHPERHKPTVV